MFTETGQDVHSREDCIEAAAEALARCYQRLAENTTTASAAEAAEAV